MYKVRSTTFSFNIPVIEPDTFIIETLLPGLYKGLETKSHKLNTYENPCFIEEVDLLDNSIIGPDWKLTVVFSGPLETPMKMAGVLNGDSWSCSVISEVLFDLFPGGYFIPLHEILKMHEEIRKKNDEEINKLLSPHSSTDLLE